MKFLFLNFFFHSENANLTVELCHMLFSVLFMKKYSVKLTIVYLKLNILINTYKDIHFWYSYKRAVFKLFKTSSGIFFNNFQCSCQAPILKFLLVDWLVLHLGLKRLRINKQNKNKHE